MQLIVVVRQATYTRYFQNNHNKHRATYSGESICESGLSVHIYSHRLQPQSHHHATYCGGSACESGLSVHDSHRLKAQSYPHATYSGGSIRFCESGLPIHDSYTLKAQSYLHATYSGGSICESYLYRQATYTDTSTTISCIVRSQHVCNIEKNFELTIYKTYNNSMLRYVYIVVTREVSLTNN